ncbi:MAG: hypothetical protein SFW36_19355, partial [Leptolyngbyaceae cyanobacterium bins.59]|nr:hypothetical protein [Leptolyngbyaceae cyanobacterium bins.59]
MNGFTEDCVHFSARMAIPLSSAVPLAQTNPTGLDIAFLGFLGPTVVNLLGAIAILVLGWLIAGLVSSGVRTLLKNTNLDNRLAGMVAGSTGNLSATIETWVSAAIFWVLMILAIVAALNALNLTVVSQPLTNFLNQIFAFLPKLGSAAILTAVAWLVATIAKALVTR